MTMMREIRIECVKDGGIVVLTDDQYMAQLMSPNSFWRCPECGGSANWDGIYYMCPSCGDFIEENEFDVCPSCGHNNYEDIVGTSSMGDDVEDDMELKEDGVYE